MKAGKFSLENRGLIVKASRDEMGVYHLDIDKMMFFGQTLNDLEIVKVGKLNTALVYDFM